MTFNPFVFSRDLFAMLVDLGEFFSWFLGWRYVVPGTNFAITPLGIFAGLGGAVILVIIIRAIIRAVAV